MGRELLPESTRAGLNAARVRGRLKRKMTEQKLLSAKKLLAASTPPKEVASHLLGAATGSLAKPSEMTSLT